MIYVYVDGKRMAYLQSLLNAQSLLNIEDLQKGDTLILPVIDKHSRELPLQKGKLRLNKLEGITLFVPFPYAFVQERYTVYYYMRDLEIVQKNAYLTALGFTSYIADLPIDLLDICIDVIGYGICGKAICDALDAMHIRNRIIRRKAINENEIDMESYKGMRKSSLLVNTAPVNYLGLNDLGENVKCIIDISSERVFPKSLINKGIEVLYPGSLPNRYAPYSAACILYDYMKGKINER